MGQNCSCLDGLSRDGRRAALANTRASEDQSLLRIAAAQGAPCSIVDHGSSAQAAIADATTKSCNGDLTYSQKAPPPLHSEETTSQDDEQEQSPEKLRAPVAELGPDGLPSVGSAGHFSGDCKRCAFFPKGRCQNGHACEFCHFDHEKNKRAAKKKRGNSSLPSTPSCANGTSEALLAGVDPSGSLLYSPLGHHSGFSGTPSPVGASPVTLSVAMLAPAEMPAPPDETADASAIGHATAGESSIIADHLKLASTPLSWTENVLTSAMASPAGWTGEQMTIEELLCGTPSGVAMSEDQQQVWQQLQQQEDQYWTQADQFAFYSEYYEQSQEYLAASMMYKHAIAAVPSQSQTVLGTTVVAPSAGLGKDSARTQILAMCGAWGALSEESRDGHHANPPQAGDLESGLSPPLSREVLLGYRAMYQKPAPPDSMKAMHMTADDPKRIAPKRGVKNGQRRGRAS